MKLGISSYTFGWAVGVRGHEPERPLDEHGLLDYCSVHGIKLLQIGDNLPLHTFAPTRLECFAVRARQEGVQLEIGARGLTAERIAEYTAIARRLNAKLIRFVIDDADYRPTPAQAADVLRQSRSELNGLTLGIENHDRFHASTLRQIIENTGSERIGICLDTANSLGAGEGLQTVLNELASLTVNLHIKDFHIERMPQLMGFCVSGRPAGAGFLDFPAILKHLAPFRRCHTAILELWTPPESRLDDTVLKEKAWAEQSLQYLKPFFPEFTQ